MKRIIFLASLILLAAVVPLQATTRYVVPGTCTNNITTYDPTGNGGAGACTGGTARVYSSIANGLNAGTTVAGDILYIRAGTYSENIDTNSVSMNSGTSFANAVTIAGYPGEIPRLKLANIANSSIHYVIFDNLLFDATLGGSLPDNGFTVYGADHIRVQNSEIKASNGFGQGVFTDFGGTNNAGYNEFINLNVHGWDGHGFYITTANNLIDGCYVHHNGGNTSRSGYNNHYQITIYNGNLSVANNNVIRNNTLTDSVCSTDGCAGMVIGSGSGTIIYNNVIYGLLAGGIDICCSGNSVKVYNNTIYNNPVYGIQVESGSGHIIRNNILYNNGTTITGGGTTVSNNYTSNPNFVNAGSADFHLSAGSGAINFGCGTGACSTELTAIFTTDLEGNSRGAVPWDAGAYEYQAAAGDSMSILVPDGGQNWTIGSSQTITWSCVGCGGGGIDIDLDRDNNGTFEESIADNTANDGSFTWTVTGSASTTCKIRIQDSDGSPTDTSAAVFTISASAGGGTTVRISNNTIGTKVGDIPGTQDIYLFSAEPTVNTGSDTLLFVSKDNASWHNHGLLRFTGLSQIPSSATVTSVTLGLYLADAFNATAQSIELRRLLRTWGENTATWNTYDGSNNWTTAGALGAATDRDSTVLATMSGIGTTNQYYTVTDTGNLKTFVQNIVSGSATNEGLHLEDTTQDDGYRGFVSTQGLDGERPYLEVTYTVGSSTITVTEPKLGDVFLSGQTGKARWTSQGVSGNVRIDLSRDGGTTWETLVASASFDSPDADLTFLAPTSSNCRVRVVSLNDTNILGTSSSFRIGGTRAGFLLTP